MSKKAEDAAKVDHTAQINASPIKWGRMPSNKSSVGIGEASRSRRKPFKSNSNRSLKGLHAQMLAKHDHQHEALGHGNAESVGYGTTESVGYGNAESVGYGHAESVGHENAESVGYGNAEVASEFNEPPTDPSMHSLFPGGDLDGVHDDGKSSAPGSFATNTSSSNGYGGPSEQKQLVKHDSLRRGLSDKHLGDS